MGDRYTLEIECDWCGEVNKDVCYASSSGIKRFSCEHCGKPNKIKIKFVTDKILMDKVLNEVWCFRCKKLTKRDENLLVHRCPECKEYISELELEKINKFNKKK